MNTTPRHKLIALAAGGTGGHLFPAQALAEELVRRGYVVHLMSDERVSGYGAKFPAADSHVIPSATIAIKKPWTWPKALWRLWSGYKASKDVFSHTKPAAVVGFGGYPSLPPVWTASRMNIPTIIHDQNAVLGRANRLLAGRVDAIAASFAKIDNLGPELAEKVVMTGAPVRDLVLKHAASPYAGPTPKQIANAHLVIGRGGASTIAELGVIGRPAILVPLPGAIDNDQLKNAQSFAGAGGGWLMQQGQIEPIELAAFLTRIRYQPEELEGAARAALGHGMPNAAEKLADLVEQTIMKKAGHKDT